MSGFPRQPAIGPGETAEEAREVKERPGGAVAAWARLSLSGFGSRAGLGAPVKVGRRQSGHRAAGCPGSRRRRCLGDGSCP